MLKRQNINNQINLRFTPATNLKVGTFVLTPNFTIQKKFPKNTTTPKRTISNN